MSIREFLPHLDPLCAALNLDDLDGVQLYEAGRLLTFHHPPLNPDVGALLLLAGELSLGGLRHVLLNQYPPEHLLRLAEGSPAAVTVQDVRLSDLDGVWSGEWGALYVPPLAQASSFERCQESIAHLRAPEGCPWDRKQTHASLRPYLLEETYEVLDALDSGNLDDLREELGDLLLQIVLHSQIAVDLGEFRMADVIAHINAKIIHRHPHVWGDVNVTGEDDVKVNWDKLKQAEKNARNGQDADAPPVVESRLDGVPRSLPALSQAFTYQDRAARVKFDWDTLEPVVAKVREELDEVLNADGDDDRAGEMGDLLFAVVNWARWLNIDPESALRGANMRFYRRFHYIEQQAAAQHKAVDDLTFEEMDALWEAAKDAGL